MNKIGWLIMKKFRIALCVVGVCFLSACAQFKDTGKAIGHVAKATTESVGDSGREGLESINKSTNNFADSISDSN